MIKNGKLIFSEEYLTFNLGPEHPMNPQRLISFKLLLNSLKFDQESLYEIVTPDIASDEDILTVHSSAYMDALKLAEKNQKPNILFGLGFGDNPVFEKMELISRMIVGGTLKATKFALNNPGSVVFNVLAGLHHARPDRASGFCYYNDCNIAIKYALKQGLRKILYIDTDCHSGDGVTQYFNNKPEVLTISFHESGNYLFPGTDFEYNIGIDKGAGYTWNLPLEPYTSDDEYIRVFRPIIQKAFNFFNPEIVFWQCGVDTYFLDPLTHLQLTTSGYQQIAEIIYSEISKRNLSVIMMGGGGYSPLATARGWLVEFFTMTGLKNLPSAGESWIEYCKKEFSDFPKCTDLLDNFKIQIKDLSPVILQKNIATLNNLTENLKKVVNIP